MKKAAMLWSLLVAVSPSVAGAAGMNLRLDDCGGFGTVDAAANCASNTGIAISMVGSAVAPAGLNRVVACDAYINSVTSSASLGASLNPWWMLGATGCRTTALTFSFDFTAGPHNCVDFWGGAATGGGAVSPEHLSPNHFRIQLVCAIPYEAPIQAGVEYYLFRVNISRAKSTGAGACAGCSDAACFVMDHLSIIQPQDVGDVKLTMPIVGNFVTYNGGAVGPGPHGGMGCPGATPSRNRTWGQVKSLYR